MRERRRSSKRPRQAAPRPAPLRPAENARQLALAVLDADRENRTFVTNLLDEFLAANPLPPNERRLATEIVLGVVRRRSTLDALIERKVQRPRQQVEPRLWNLLQLGVYQLLFLSSVPTHAAVHETVELTRWIGKPGATKFVNGVLRAITRILDEETAAQAAANTIPIAEGKFLKLTEDVFDDPQSEPVRYLSRALSLPGWLVRRWHKRFGFDDLLQMGVWFNTVPTLCLRVNSLKTDRPALLQRLEDAGIEAAAGVHPQAVRVLQSARVTELPGFTEGEFAVQDDSAMTAATRLAPAPGETVLDMCAAPGTKTMHLAELMQNTGTLIATDVNEQRLLLVNESSTRLGVDIVQTQPIAADGHDLPAGPFDAILLDVPCSNTGVLGKRVDARWRITADDLVELPQIQRRLLEAAYGRLAPRGRILYSTCSIEVEENRSLIDAFLAAHPDLTKADEAEFVPGRPADGGYQALLVHGDM